MGCVAVTDYLGDPAATAQVAPLLSGGTRVLISHDVEAGLAEADLVLGLRGERAVLTAAAAEVTPADVKRLYA